MIPADGGGRRPPRQALYALDDGLGRHKWGGVRHEYRAAFRPNRGVLALQCDGGHSQSPRSRIACTRRTVSTAAEAKDLLPSGRSPKSQSRAAAPRGLVRSAALALISHCAGIRARRLRYFRGLGRRARKFQPPLNGRETPYVHGHGCAGTLAWRRSACSAAVKRAGAARLCPYRPDSAQRRLVAGRRGRLTDAIRLGSVPGEAGVIRHRLAILRACRIVLRPRAPGPGESGKGQSAIAARAAMASAPQRSAGLSRHLGHDPGHRGVNFGVGQRAFARLQGHMDGDRLRALGHAFAAINVEHADPGDERRVRRSPPP